MQTRAAIVWKECQPSPLKPQTCKTPSSARCWSKHGAAHLLAGHRTNSANPQLRATNGGQGDHAYGAVASIHRFGSSLNEQVHFHVCVVDVVFEEGTKSVIFHPASARQVAS
jgi:hypothetical protein